MLVVTQTYTLPIPCEVYTPKEVYDEAIGVLLKRCENSSVAELWGHVVVLFDDNGKLHDLMAWAEDLSRCNKGLTKDVFVSISTSNYFLVGRFIALTDYGVGRWSFVAALIKFLMEQFGIAVD